ncbi:hypothetical protein PEC301899_27960 [Pectobacterium carotovorum subsp. carotovorum]|nr:hypothetical protein PEC301899_27960 [Pectobacterium carotovorum subsp. carotovorum]
MNERVEPNYNDLVSDAYFMGQFYFSGKIAPNLYPQYGINQ